MVEAILLSIIKLLFFGLVAVTIINITLVIILLYLVHR